LGKAGTNLEKELSKIKAMSIDDIPIEQRLAINKNMPDNIKAYVLEKWSELDTDEPNYKLQMAINGLLSFPWKPIKADDRFSKMHKSIKETRLCLKNVADKLDKTVFGHEDTKHSLIELMAKWIQNPDS